MLTSRHTTAALSLYCLCQVLYKNQYAFVSTHILLCCSKYQNVQEVVLGKLCKAWDSDNNTLVALKVVELHGFAAASAWADAHLAVPSSRVRYALLVGRTPQALKPSIISDMPLSLTAYCCAGCHAVLWANEAYAILHLQKSAWWVFSGIYALVA